MTPPSPLSFEKLFFVSFSGERAYFRLTGLFFRRIIYFSVLFCCGVSNVDGVWLGSSCMGFLVNDHLRVRPVRGCDACGCGMGALGRDSHFLPREPKQIRWGHEAACESGEEAAGGGEVGWEGEAAG